MAIMHALEWQRTRPDLRVYIPECEEGPDAANQHFVVTPTTTGAWLAVWTSSTYENHPDQRVVVSRSIDKGHTWTRPAVLDGQRDGDGRRASWGFPVVVSDSGRIYVFYNKNIGITDAREDTTGVLRFRYSDDDGLSWSDQAYDLTIGDAAIDHPDPSQPKNWVIYQPPVVLSNRTVFVGFTRWASRVYNPDGHLFTTDAEVWFLRFDNILTEHDPSKLRVTTLPDGDRGLRVLRHDMPAVSVAQEPTVVELSDGRWLCVMRTLNGTIAIATSGDGGHSWSTTRTLLDRPGGVPLLNPIAPCPLYNLHDGRYLLVFYNNDGTANGGSGPADAKKNRYPCFMTIGRETGDADQPLRFGAPKVFATSNGVLLAGTPGTQVATYPSLVQERDMRVFFYPDRKHFLLGRYLTDAWLQDCDPRF